MKQKSFYIFFILIFTIIIIILFKINLKHDFQEDILFFKLLGNTKKTDKIDSKNFQNENIYFFNVSYKNINFKTIDLERTIDKETLINEKIAPGTKGKFEIIIYSNKYCYYQVRFKSGMEKPKNMIFYISKDNKVYTLKELERQLNGRIEADKTKEIEIYWEWRYESEQDHEDTKDGKNIKNYCFDIWTEAT